MITFKCSVIVEQDLFHCSGNFLEKNNITKKNWIIGCRIRLDQEFVSAAIIT